MYVDCTNNLFHNNRVLRDCIRVRGLHLVFPKQTQCQYVSQLKFACLCAHSRFHVSQMQMSYLHFRTYTPPTHFYPSRVFTPHTDTSCIYTRHTYLIYSVYTRQFYTYTFPNVCVSHSLTLFLSPSPSLALSLSLFLSLSLPLSFSLLLSLSLFVRISLYSVFLSLSLSLSLCRLLSQLPPLLGFQKGNLKPASDYAVTATKTHVQKLNRQIRKSVYIHPY